TFLLLFLGKDTLFATTVSCVSHQSTTPHIPSLKIHLCLYSLSSLTVSQVGQNFTFVLTDVDSKQRFGFCRLSSGAKTCFCILSYLPWFEVFYKLLNILAEYTAKGQPIIPYLPYILYFKSLTISFLKTNPQCLSFWQHSYFTTPDNRELPSIPENRNLTEYFVAVDVNNMLHLYASMLYERRILISCSKLSSLTACVHGSAAMLYPMYWQHVYIPVLPPHLLDYCCAPMPYLIGVHSSLMEKVRNMALEDVVILNVDNNTLETPFDDLQSLPNDVLSTLKNRLKKVSTTTGNGVARAFLKTQAMLFGSYRNALKIEPEEPITFCEDIFVSHRSSAMRQFLQNAIQLQLFKQFIDGRLDLLNSGKGFSDEFEEEINNSEYAGINAQFSQQKGSGAILNTMKTKANPAMKTVYKFAKDHAKMGIKEVKNRLKQKEMAENGYTAATEDSSQQRSVASPLPEKREGKERGERRPITVHFGQARPPRPLVVKRPRGTALPAEAHRPSVSSPEQLQPYKTLKESDVADSEAVSLGKPFPSLAVSSRTVDVNILDEIFSSLKVTSQHQPLSQAKSMEDLRTPKEEGEMANPFGHQVGLLLTRIPCHKLWSMGQDDMALDIKSVNNSSFGSLYTEPDGEGSSRDMSQATSDLNISNITIPRPQGRKSAEKGIVLPPPLPASRGVKQQTFAGTNQSFRTEKNLEGSDLRQSQNSSPQPSASSCCADILKPIRVSAETGSRNDLLSLLDPLSASPSLDSGQSSAPSGSLALGQPLSTAPVAYSSSRVELGINTPSPSLPFSPNLTYSKSSPGSVVQFPHPTSYPFSQAIPAVLQFPQNQPSGTHFPAPSASAFTSSFLPSVSGFFQPPRPQRNYSSPSLNHLYSTNTAIPQSGTFIHLSANSSAAVGGASYTKTNAQVALADAKLGPDSAGNSTEPPLAPTNPSKSLEGILQLLNPGEPVDPFAELLNATRQEVVPSQTRVDQLRKKWETFE
uniref:DENN domain containing 1A n=1 Tax=Callorhinchus milii TaxID=7868 RepID=A0A4W3IWU3_CALMI